MANVAADCLSPVLMHAAARIDVVDALRALPVAPEIRVRAFLEWCDAVGEMPSLWEERVIAYGVPRRDYAARKF